MDIFGVVHAIAEEVGKIHATHSAKLPGALHFIAHGFQNDVVVTGSLRRQKGGDGSKAYRKQGPSEEKFGRGSSLLASYAGTRQERRSILGALFALNFDFTHQQRGGDGGDGNAARFGAADAIEHFHAIGGRQNLSEARKRCPDNVHSADQLIRPAVGVNGYTVRGTTVKACRPRAAVVV